MIKDLELTIQLNDKIEDIAKCLINSKMVTPDLMNGKSGEILFWAYYSKYKKNNFCESRVAYLLNNVFNEIQDGFIIPTFAGGLAGIGWTFEHLVRNDFIDANTNETIGSLDDNLYQNMLYYIRNGNYDYLHGALGIGLYYLNRDGNSITREYLHVLIDELDKKSTKTDKGIAWETVKYLDSDLKGFNFSMSHGIASIISILCRIYKADINKPKVYELLNGSIDYLLNNKQDPSKYKFQFPTFISKNETDNNGRLSWCYNDLGISFALWQAGIVLGNKLIENEAIKIALNTTKYKEKKDTGIIDGGLCHGAAGVAHLYHKMYLNTGVDAFKYSSLFWFEESIKMGIYKDGLAGYKTFLGQEYGGYQKCYGLLEGIAGIGLAMISAVSEIEPKWDECLLLS